LLGRLGNLALEESSPKTENFSLYQIKASSMKQTYLRDMFKKASRSVCTSTIVVSPDPLSPTRSTPAATKTQKITEQDPDHYEPADEGHIQMEYFLTSFTAQV
jgi:hypothetical protein